MKHIYIDHAASTPIHPDVAETMLKVMREQFGNASSVHSFGREAKRLVNGARDTVAARIGCRPDELVFTGGGTESDNLALFGTASARKRTAAISSRPPSNTMRCCIPANDWRRTGSR
ncbi:hypothetical protein HMSSN139_67210 [Paenibacillus sp. HMSSN-139]|nr:hypothetical protein HMSSN139_67210 [Paenibacillus sp. HMSSN-139]